MSSYIDNIQRNRAAYRATLNARARAAIHMQTYTFTELSGQAKHNAIHLYGETQEVDEQAAMLMDQGFPLPWLEDAAHVFSSLGWRFNEHGERVA